jgi:branched-subunit amino acid transport protein
MTVLIALGGAVIVSWLLRVLVVTVLPASRLPEQVRRALPDVGPVVFAALVAGALLGRSGAPNPSALAAIAVTGVVVWRTHRVGSATAAGLLAAGLVGWVS